MKIAKIMRAEKAHDLSEEGLHPNRIPRHAIAK